MKEILVVPQGDSYGAVGVVKAYFVNRHVEFFIF
jgi:hypothetical protein